MKLYEETQPTKVRVKHFSQNEKVFGVYNYLRNKGIPSKHWNDIIRDFLEENDSGYLEDISNRKAVIAVSNVFPLFGRYLKNNKIVERYEERD